MKRQTRKSLLLVVFLVTTIVLLNFTSCDTTEPTPSIGVDTTTQNFTFETFEFGDGFSSSYFKEVWIFDENNIWAVGYLATDSVSNANIMRWDGDKWYIENFSGTSSGIEGVWALDSSHIYFASGGIRKYENGTFSNVNTNLGLTRYQGIHKLWGSSANNIWGVGPGGTIVHFDGTEWKKIDFDEQWYFYQITGNSKTGIAYATASDSSFTYIIVELNSLIAKTIYNSSENPKELVSIGVKMLNDTKLILSAHEIWSFDLVTKETIILEDLSVGYGLTRISLSGENDVYFWGNKYNDGEKLVHFNGIRFREFDLPERDYVFHGGAFSIKDLSIMVAASEHKAYLIKGER